MNWILLEYNWIINGLHIWTVNGLALNLLTLYKMPLEDICSELAPRK